MEYKSIIEIFNAIYDWYITTEEYSRKKCLGLAIDSIILTDEAPLYELGIRGVEMLDNDFESIVFNYSIIGDTPIVTHHAHSSFMSFMTLKSKSVYNLYCNLNFITHNSFKYFIMDDKCKNTYIIDKEHKNNGCTYEYYNKLLFMCDVSNIYFKTSKYQKVCLDNEMLINYIEYHLNLSSLYYEYDLDIDVTEDNIKSISNDIEMLKKFLNNKSNNGLSFTYNSEESPNMILPLSSIIRISMSIQNSELNDEIKYMEQFMLEMMKDDKLNNKLVDFDVCFVLSKDSFMKFYQDIKKERLGLAEDYIGFKSLSTYKNNFKTFNINVVSDW